ncbi:MAG: GNAT family protein [Candidatus Magasanikbacteria bacterium]
MKSPILKGPRVTLRPIKLSDASDYVRWFKDKEVVRYLGNKLLNIKEKGVKDFFSKMIRSKENLLWAIIAPDGVHIGNTVLRLDDGNKRAGFGIVIGDKKYWGQGYGPECLKILENYVFKKLNYNRLHLTVFTDNRRAVKAYQKAGFKKEGILRKHIFAWVGMEYCDEYMMSILHQEWSAKKHK